MHNNPYSNASDAYNKVKTEGGDQRALEGNVLLKAARKLQAVRDNWDDRGAADLEEALVYNRKLWTVFAGETTNDDHPLPLDLKNNIANLSIFVFKRTIQVQIDEKPEMLDALIEINRNIAAGLLAQPGPEKSGSENSNTENTGAKSPGSDNSSSESSGSTSALTAAAPPSGDSFQDAAPAIHQGGITIDS